MRHFHAHNEHLPYCYNAISPFLEPPKTLNSRIADPYLYWPASILAILRFLKPGFQQLWIMAPTSVWSMKRPIAVISQSGRDRIEILKKPLKTMCLTLVPLGLLRRLPKKLVFFVHWRISSVTHRHANCFISLFTNWTRAAVWPLMANGGRRSSLRTPARLAISVSVSCFLRSASRISRNFSGSIMQPSSIKPKLKMSKV